MIPLRDDNPTTLYPWVTVVLIGCNLLLYGYELTLGAALESFLFAYGAIPAILLTDARLPDGVAAVPAAVTVFSSMFLHGGLFHVAGNMLYLWIFGNNIEDALGHGRFLLFYLISGVVAVYAHALMDPQSSVPMIGASGAVSGVLGAYLVLFPRVRVLALVPVLFFVQLMRVPAFVMLGFWIVLQLLNGFLSVGMAGGGVAWFAHVGGFVVGVVLIRGLVRKGFRPRIKV